MAIAVQAKAQVIPPSEQPGRERERFTEPQRPRAVPGGPAISLPSTTAPAGANKLQVVIRKIQIVGSTVYSEEDLRPFYQALLSRRVSVQAVYDLAQRITAKYGADGYVLSRAIVPEQEFDPRGATVRIEIIEGYVDRVVWPEKIRRYRDFFSDYARKITAERPINIRTLERYLLLASDLPGLKFTTTLQASKSTPGASTLIVEVIEKPFDFDARLDNRGTKARGPLEFLFSPTFNNLTGNHEALTLSYASVSPIKELQYAAMAYRQVLNSEGLTLFANGSYSWGFPGTAQLESLDFNTRSTYIESGFSFPVIRARERNLNVAGMVFEGENYSFWNLTPGVPQAVDRLRGVRVRADGDIADQLGGINQLSVTVSQGVAGLGSTTNDNPIASRVGGQVDFTKIEGSGSRLQPLAHGFSAVLAAYGQYAFTPLLVPEQCGYGGRVFGRAFDPSTLIADSCWMVSGELRYDLPTPINAPPGQVIPLPNAQVFGFADKAKLYRLSALPLGTGSTTFDGASAGVGVRWFWGTKFNIDLTAAKAIQGPQDQWRVFFVAVVHG